MLESGSRRPSDRMMDGFKPSRREVLATATLAPAAALGRRRGRSEPRPRAVLWVEALEAPAACDLLDPSLGAERFEARTRPDGWARAARPVGVSPSPFAPCGAITDALARLAVRGARGCEVSDRAALEQQVAGWLGVEPLPSGWPLASTLTEAGDRLAHGARHVRVEDHTAWGRLLGLPAQAARLDSGLADCRTRCSDPDGLLVVVLGRGGRRPWSRLPERRERGADRSVLVAQGPGSEQLMAFAAGGGLPWAAQAAGRPHRA